MHKVSWGMLMEKLLQGSHGSRTRQRERLYGSGGARKPQLLPWGTMKLGWPFKEVSLLRQWGWVIVPPGHRLGNIAHSLQLREIPGRIAHTIHTTPDPRGSCPACTQHSWPAEGLGTDLRPVLVLRHCVAFSSSQKIAWLPCAQEASSKGHAQKVLNGNHLTKRRKRSPLCMKDLGQIWCQIITVKRQVLLI